MKKIGVLLFILLLPFSYGKAQKGKGYWNNKLRIVSFRLPPPPVDYKPGVADLNGDGKPDAIYSITRDSIPVLWLDDDGNMTWDDLEGDTTNDCLLIDRNRDGIYGGHGDLVIDWIDTNNDGRSDMQIVVEYPPQKAEEVWPNGHYMIVLDTDKDDIFNYIDWNSMQIKSWDKSGICDFYMDYSGRSAFLKIHASTYNMADVRYNWENPFLFYDEDGDGLSEMAIRILDSTKATDPDAPSNSYVNKQVNGVADWVSIAVDMDNDNRPGDEFDFDFTISFRGKGFDYKDQVHTLHNPRLPGTDSLFIDPRFRQMTELIYPGHESAWDLIFKRGKWDRVYFVYDEDDDCHRWERVELYDPFDPFKVGWNGGGIDNNKQSDAAGDRGEWDMDNSGGGKLYVGKFDGRLHLYGAEWGCWRIDQNTDYYQGWDRLWFGLDRNPSKFATVKYADKDGNGFFDGIEYDLDGDHVFETVIDLNELGIDDRCELIDIAGFTYKDFTDLTDKMAGDMWRRAMEACAVAERYKQNTGWYAKLKQASSVREKYHKGYWLQLYLYKDLEYLFIRNKDEKSLAKLNKAYYSGDWQQLSPNESLTRPEFLSEAFRHPGMAQSREDLDYMAEMIWKEAQPWKDAFENLKKKASLDFTPKAFDRISVGPYGANSIGGREFSESAEAAYNHALMWYITKEKAYADKTIEILNVWSYKLRSFDANNAKLNVGLFGYHYLNAAEILKHTESGWASKDMEQFTRMVLTVFYPTIEDFFTEANGNWDGSMINTMMCIGVFTDNHQIFNRAVERFYRGEGNSGIMKYIYPGGQCQETTRDWGHVQLGIGELAKAAQIASTQGLDFYRVADDRLARGFEYTARFMLGEHIDLFGVYTERDNDKFRDIYESVYQYYKESRGISLPYTEAAILKHIRPASSVGFLTGVRAAASRSRAGKPEELAPETFLLPTETGALKDKYAEAPADAVCIQPGESIQQAIDAHKGSGKWIVLKAGIHTLQEPLKLYSDITLAGQGRETILHLAQGKNTTAIVNGADDLENVLIRDLLIEGAVNVTENADPNHDRRTRSYMSAPSREGIVLWSENNRMKNIRFDQVTVQNFTKSGVAIVGGTDIDISRCDFSDNGGNVVPGEGFHHNLLLSYVTNCTVLRSRFDTSPWGNGIDATFCKKLSVQDCEMARNKRSGIRCAESEEVTITGSRSEGNDRHGIFIEKRMDSCRNVIIRRNILLHNGITGICIQKALQLSMEENRGEGNRENIIAN